MKEKDSPKETKRMGKAGKGTASRPAAKENADQKRSVKKTPAVRKPVRTEKPDLAFPLLELCEKVAFDRKAEKIIRLDMRELENAQSDCYLLCTGFSEPHIGAIAERIRREVRTQLGIRPLLCNGDPRSHWIIIDYGSVIIHIMTPEAREKYQLEELWGDAPRKDVLEKLDREARKRKKTLPGTPEEEVR